MTTDSIETTDINSKPLSDWEAKGLFLKKLWSELICSVPMDVIGTRAQLLSSSDLFIAYTSAGGYTQRRTRIFGFSTGNPIEDSCRTSMDDRNCPTSRRHSSVESKIFLRYDGYSFQEVSLDALAASLDQFSLGLHNVDRAFSDQLGPNILPSHTFCPISAVCAEINF
ncbi:hypothetical protein C8J57DRAFT_207239 [Mycena rebaudengoi]|nr:hypothetical protein C8J57DRAFT_207239 [Mycena rebaudengoi]